VMTETFIRGSLCLVESRWAREPREAQPLNLSICAPIPRAGASAAQGIWSILMLAQDSFAL
jgi:hypothetical protein